MIIEENIKVRPQSPGTLAASYGISRNTLNSWLKPHREKIGQRIGKIYTPAQVKKIYEILGEP